MLSFRALLSKRIEPFAKPLLSLIPRKKGIVILTFHYLSENDFAWFEAVLNLIIKKSRLISPNDLNSSNYQNEGGVLLTFDDGFYSDRMLAEKFLKRFNVKGIFFITEGFLGLVGIAAATFMRQKFLLRINNVVNQPRALAIEDVKWLISEGHCIGAHTANHCSLKHLSYQEKYAEIIDSAERLEEELSFPIRHFAFPFGSVSTVDDVSRRLAESRFDFMFSNIRGYAHENKDNTFLFRQNLVPGMPLWMVDAIIDGRFDCRHYFSRKKVFMF